MFTKKGRSLETLRPPSGALKPHLRRAALQANCWGQTLEANQVLPNPIERGWVLKTGDWLPFWTNQTEVAESLRILVRCGCTKGCKTACKCRKNYLACTALCLCNGDCAD